MLWEKNKTIFHSHFVLGSIPKGSICHCNAVGDVRTDVLLDTGDGS